MAEPASAAHPSSELLVREVSWTPSIVSGVICFATLAVWYAGFVHYFFGGMPHGTFLPSKLYGPTKAEKEANWLPVYAPPDTGWDGQCYFDQATDPFLLTDAPKLSDNAGYRYQRNGVPFAAWVVAKVIREYPTSGWTYQLTQFAFVGIGFAFLVQMLRECGRPAWYALAWLFCGGFFALFRGLPDNASDAVFIVSLYTLLHRKLGFYTAATTLLLICREGYAVYAATIFLMSCFNGIPWNRAGRWKAVALTALPGVCLVAWACYIGYKLNQRPLGGAGSVPFGALVDWPFHAYYVKMTEQWRTNPWYELTLKTLCAGTIFVTMVSLLAKVRRQSSALPLLPYVVLISMTGHMIWLCENGYPKATSAVVVIAMFYVNPRFGLLSLLMAAHLFFGYRVYKDFNVKYQPYLHQDFVTAREEVARTRAAAKLPASIETVNPVYPSVQYEMTGERVPTPAYDGLFRRFHRDPLIYIVHAKNTGEITWFAQKPATPQSFSVAWQVFDEQNRCIAYQREYLAHDVPPGESYTCVVPLTTFPKHPKVRLEVTLTQDPEVFFSKERGGGALHVEISNP